MTRVSLATAALVAAVAVSVAIALPPARADLSRSFDDGTIAGALHVHTNRSDGRSAPAVVAAAAKRAGLAFVAFADHGDGTRPPDHPVYRDGVLCLDGVEISTTGGHYLALNLPVSPYPLGGAPEDVVEDVRRLGGFGIAAHPDSPKSELRWQDWDAPVDGVEVVNPDTAWRVIAQTPGWQPRLRLLGALLAYPFRSAETIANLVDDVSETTAHWDELTRRRPVVGTSGVDAHAVIGWKDVDPRSWNSLPLPSYEASFRSLSLHVRPTRPLTGDAVADAAALVDGLRRGHAYSALDGLAGPPAFTFSAENTSGTVGEGEQLAPGGPVTLRVRSNAPPAYTTTVLAGGRIVGTGQATDVAVTVPADGRAVYRVEIRDDGPRHRLWLASNPIYVGAPDADVPASANVAATSRLALFTGADAGGWRTEGDAASGGQVALARGENGTVLRFAYHLAGGPAPQSSTALVVDVPNGLAAEERVTITARADRPMRVSLQLRAGTGAAFGDRWARSLYFDGTERTYGVDLGRLRPLGRAADAALPPADIRSILLVIDRGNAKPDATGTIWVRSATIDRP